MAASSHSTAASMSISRYSAAWACFIFWRFGAGRGEEEGEPFSVSSPVSRAASDPAGQKKMENLEENRNSPLSLSLIPSGPPGSPQYRK